MKKTTYYKGKISSILEWDEKTKILTHTTFDSQEREEAKMIVEGFETYSEAKKFSTT